jgi:hypothetical protein
MKKEYNEVYGFMPTEIVNHLSEADRMKLFLDWLRREPTAAGWKIVFATVSSLGEKFLEYVFQCVADVYREEDEPLTKEDLVNDVKNLFQSFATDLNLFRDYVDTYLEETSDSEVEDQDQKTPARDARGRFVKKEK